MTRIYRFLAIASGALLLVALVVMSWFYNLQATRNLVNMTARHNIVLDRILANTIWMKYEAYLILAGDLDGAALRARPETDEIERLVTWSTRGISILKVKIYSPEGLTLFSTDRDDIGADYSASEALREVLETGKPVSELSYEDFSSRFSGEAFGRDVVETYIPQFGRDGRPMAVVELYSDVTDDKALIDATTVQVVIGSALVFLCIYAVLVAVIMRRAMAPIRHASEMAEQIGPDCPGRRLPTDGIPAEIRPLVAAVNGALDRLDRALDVQRRFTAEAAHELLTPLAVMRAELDAIGGDGELADVRRDVDDMTAMVRRLLYLAELEAEGGAAGERVRTDLRAAAEHVVSDIAPAALAEGKEVALTAGDAPVWVPASRPVLIQIVRNLAENALRHAPAGTVVEVEVGGDGSLRVSDQGPGVPEAARERIFDAFWRADKNSGPGAGLGLSIVRRLVESHGGRVFLDEGRPRGACFVVELPLAKAE